MPAWWSRVDKEIDFERRFQEMERAVNDLIKRNEELVVLYEKIGQDENQRSDLKAFLLDLVETWPRFQDQRQLLPVGRLRQLTVKYFKAEWLHTPWIANQLLRGLIVSTFEPVDRELRRVYITRLLTSVVSLAWFIGIYALFVLNFSLFAWFGVTVSLWYYGRRLMHTRRLFPRVAEEYDSFVVVGNKIDGIIAELDEDSYCPSEVIRTLQWVETKLETQYLPTITYLLLRLREQDMQESLTRKPGATQGS